MRSVDLNIGTISGTTHIKTVFSFWPGIGKHFTGNALWISDNSVMQLIHILLFYMVSRVLYKPPEKNSEKSNLENEGPGNFPQIFLSNDQEDPCPKRHKCDQRSEVVHHVTEKLFSIMNRKCYQSL
jgi:hypothetical protein